MASGRVNTKFLLLLGMIVLGIIGVGGFLYALNYRGDSARNMAKAEALYQDGKLREAFEQYGRAVNKNPGDAVALEKLKKVLLQIRPESRSEAAERYSRYLGILRRRPDQNPADVEGHQLLIQEQHTFARMFGGEQSWQAVRRSAENMWDRLPPDVPERQWGRMHMGFAMMRLAITSAELEEAINTLRVVTEKNPDLDLAWAGLIAAQLRLAIDTENAGNTELSEQAYADADGSIMAAMEAVPDGPETATIVVFRESLGRDAEEGERRRERVDRNVPFEYSNERLADAADHAIKCLATSDNMGLINESERILSRMRWVEGPTRAATVLEEYLERHPEDDNKRLRLAQLKYILDDLEMSEELAQAVTDAQPMTVGILSRGQHQFRQQAASLLNDIAFRAHVRGEDGDKPETFKEVEATRDRLLAFTEFPEDDLLVMKADAKLAYAQRNYSQAANLFERVDRASDNGLRESESMLLLADALYRIDQKNSSLSWLEKCADLYPGDGRVYVNISRLRRELTEFDSALELMDELIALDPNYEPAREERNRVLAAMQRSEGIVADEVEAMLIRAADLSRAGNLAEARDLVLDRYNRGGNEDVRIATALAMLEFDLGNRDEALALTNSALADFPDSNILQSLKSNLELGDPLDSLEYHVWEVKKAERREGVLAILVQLRELIDRQEAFAEFYEERGNEPATTAARELIDRAVAMNNEYMAEARQIADDSAILVELRFAHAERLEDWDELEAIVARAKDLNIDNVNGLLYQGRAYLLQRRFNEAIDVLEPALDLKPVSAVGWRGLAIAYWQVGRSNDSLDAYDQSYRRKSTDVATIREYSSALLQSGKPVRALEVLSKGVRVAPRDIAIREMYYQAMSLNGRKLEVLQARREHHAENPNDNENSAALISMLGALRPTPEIIVNPQTNRIFTAPQWASMSPAERQRMAARAQAELDAEAGLVLDKIDENLGDTLRATMLRANFLRERGKVDEGLQTIQAFMDRKPEAARSVDAVLSLASYFRSINRSDEAIRILSASRDLQDDDARQIDNAIGNLAFESRQYETAIEHLRRVYDKNPGRVLGLRIVDAISRTGAFDDAEAELERVLEGSSYDYVSLMLLGQIAEGRGLAAMEAGDDATARSAFDAQRQHLAAARESEPTNPGPSLAEAGSILKRVTLGADMSLLDQAMSALDRVDQIQNELPETRMLRSEIFKTRGELTLAATELAVAVSADPDNQRAREQLMNMHLLRGNGNAALDTVLEAIERNPTIVKWHRDAAALHQSVSRDYQEASAAHNAAYGLSNDTNDLIRSVEALFELPRVPHVRILNLLADIDEDHPDYLKILPRKARALDAGRRRDEARDLLRDGWVRIQEASVDKTGPTFALSAWFGALDKMYPDDNVAAAEAFVMELCDDEPDANSRWLLSRIWGARREFSRAVELMTSAIEMTPSDNERYAGLIAPMHFDLGGYLVGQQRWEEAIEAYNVVLDVAPDNASCLNNVAYMLAEKLSRPEEALPYAKRAVQKRPTNADYLDTLGWVHYRLGQLEEAQDRLIRSQNLRPSASVSIHLARVYLDQNDESRARSYLERAMELSPNAVEQSEIEAMEDELQGG
ncbi:MAG: tetratricopeptide repeat protein [Planctomycetota bacterium]